MPGNILVARDGVVKLVDFGIAKVVQANVADEATSTLPGQRLMTPQYASPEQIRGEPVTTTSDVYSLGVILYELLTGHRPYQLSGRAPFDIERTIRESGTSPATSTPSSRDNILTAAVGCRPAMMSLASPTASRTKGQTSSAK